MVVFRSLKVSGNYGPEVALFCHLYCCQQFVLVINKLLVFKPHVFRNVHMNLRPLTDAQGFVWFNNSESWKRVSTVCNTICSREDAFRFDFRMGIGELLG